VEKRRRALVIPKLLKEAERVSKTSKSLRGTIEIVEADGFCLKLLRPARVSTATKGSVFAWETHERSSPIPIRHIQRNKLLSIFANLLRKSTLLICYILKMAILPPCKDLW
jgi:hypothetical protein